MFWRTLALDERTQTTDNGDHERLSHYVPKDKLMDAMVNGTPVVALCGKVWIPSRDPQKFPVCPECKEIWETMRDGDKRVKTIHRATMILAGRCGGRRTDDGERARVGRSAPVPSLQPPRRA